MGTAPFSPSQDPIQGLGQEHGATVQPVRPGESGDCAKSVAIGSWEQSVMRVKNASRKARLRAKFIEMSADSIRYPENSTPLHLQAGLAAH
jgi:hypothetical protein